jgi:hypothetical protein
MSFSNCFVPTDASTFWSAHVQYPPIWLEIAAWYCTGVRASDLRVLAAQVRRKELSTNGGNLEDLEDLDAPLLARALCRFLCL